MLKTIPFMSTLLDREMSNGKKTTHLHALLYGAIEAHSQGKAGCVASTETLSQEVGMHAVSARKYLKELKDLGWIHYDSSNPRRGKIFPLLGVLFPKNNSNETLQVEQSTIAPIAINDCSYSNQPLHIDNILDNILDNSIDSKEQSSDWQHIVNYFYSKISPSTPHSMRFYKGTKEGAKHLVALHGEDRIREVVDHLTTSKSKKYIVSFKKFLEFFDSINGEIVKGTEYGSFDTDKYEIITLPNGIKTITPKKK
ncbi:helix-turn-helix domain-containing protein [Candidatus Dependentiae bacterium]|nr:MAG: helix-turn-helix domain-containing protein [Candidatus Dependentiae bacterium]